MYIYPVKSTAAVAVDRAELVERGLAGDRRWMVVDAEGRFMSQRAHPKLAVVRPTVEEGRLTLRRDGVQPLTLPARPSSGPLTSVTIWGDRCRARDAGGRAARWLGEHLGAECRLVYMPETTRRPAKLDGPTDQARAGEPLVGFADAAPLLVVEQASLDDLNARLDQAAPMNRFRPNIVVGDTEAFEADRWQRVRIGGVEFEVSGPCARCVVTNVDQHTGRKGRQPLATLAGYRTRTEGVCFGQYLVHQTIGTVAVGDAVEVLAWRE